MTDTTNFLDFLSEHHKLPSFNLPTDAVSFVARSLAPTGEEQIEVKMSNGLEKALTQYSPGKEIIVKKKTYMSGGLYLDFPPRPTAEMLEGLPATELYRRRVDSVIDRFSFWFSQKEEAENDNTLTWHHRCNTRSCQHTLESTMPRSETPDALGKCEMCTIGDYKTIPMLRPPGFAPLVKPSDGSIVDVSRSSKIEYRITTKWPTQIIGEVGEDSIKFGEHLELRMMSKKTLVNINPGKGQIEDDDGFGFTFCKKCGSLSHDDLPSEHPRPYAIPFQDLNYCGIPDTEEGRIASTGFRERRLAPCDHASDQAHTAILDEGEPYRRLVLGRTFVTDVLVFRIPWDTDDFVSMDPAIGTTNTSQISALTLLRSLLEGITGDSELGLNIDDSDIDGDIRRYRQEDEEGWELFIFERSDGGIGLLQALFEIMKSKEDEFNLETPYDFPIIGRALKRLSGKSCTTQVPDRDGKYITVRERPCKHICSGCLLDYSTQYMEKDLDRTSGFHFLLYALYGDDFGDHFGTTMSDDQRNLHNLFLRLEGGEEATTVLGDGTIGILDENVEVDIDLSPVTCVMLNSQEYKIHSPLLSEDDENSFSRSDLLNNPERILTSLQQSGVVNPRKDKDLLS